MPGHAEIEEERREERRRPITAVPTRRRPDEEEIRALREAMQRLVAELAEVREHSETLRVRPDEATIDYVNEHADRIIASVQEANLVGVPILGSRYENEIGLMQRTLEAARRAGGEGELGHAINLLLESEEQFSALRNIYDLEIRIIMEGMPDNIQVEGVEPDQAYDAFFDGIEAALLDIGTENSGRSRAILAFAELYADNARIYTIDDQAVHHERDALITTVIERGRQAERGVDYTAELAAQDTEALESFRTNIEQIAGQYRQINNDIIGTWRDQIRQAAAQQGNEQMREQMESLARRLDDAIRRINEGEILNQSEVNRLTASYYMAFGEQVPETEEEAAAGMYEVARELRGRGRRVRQGTAQWFGEQAVIALDAGDMQRASLAISMGLLERAQSGATRTLPDYHEMIDVLRGERSTTPATLSQYSDDLDMVFSLTRMREFGGITGRRGAERRTRIRESTETIEQRLAQGDAEGARRMIEMVSYYLDQLEQHNWREFDGMAFIEQAIDIERRGENGEEVYQRGQVYFHASRELDGARRSIADWRGRGIAFQRNVANQMIEYVEELAREGNRTDAARGVGYLAAYVESVERLAERRGGNVTSVSDENAVHLSGMQAAMEAFRSGQRDIDQTFYESYFTAQRVYLEDQVAAVEGLARSRETGRATIEQAISTIRQRIENNDLQGATLLLQYAFDYYGPAGQGRRQGWRYDLFAEGAEAPLPGCREGSRMILRAIEMEIQADSDDEHSAAARQFDMGTRRIAQVELLLQDFAQINGAYMGQLALVEGVEAGEVPLGERQEDGTYLSSIDMRTVTRYEEQHPEDPVLLTSEGGREEILLRNRLEQLGDAARRGNIREYYQIRDQYFERFGLVTSRAVRTRSITEARGVLRQADESLRDSFRIFAIDLLRQAGEQNPEETYERLLVSDQVPVYRTETRPTTGMAGGVRAVRVHAFERYEAPRLGRLLDSMRTLYGSRTDIGTQLDQMEAIVRQAETVERLVQRMDGIENTTAVVPLTEVASALERVQNTSRKALAYDFLTAQIHAYGQYERGLSGRPATGTRIHMEELMPRLEEARRQALAGDFQALERVFGQALYWAAGSLANYDATHAFTASASGWQAFTSGIRNMIDFFDEDERRRLMTETPDWSRYDGYVELQMRTLRHIINGTGTEQEISQGLRGARIIEASVFAVPADDAAQYFDDFTGEQARVRTLVAQGNLDAADDIFESMSEDVRVNRLIANVGLFVVGLGVSWVNPLAGGAIFTTMAIDQVITEYNMTGDVSATSWLILAGVVATMGIGGTIAALRTGAQIYRGVQATQYALRLERIATGLQWANYGIMGGFSTYLGFAAAERFSAGYYDEGAFMLIMAATPWAMHGIGRARGAYAEARAAGRPLPHVRLAARMSETLGRLRARAPAESRFEVELTEAPSERAARQLQQPERMFDLLTRLRSGEETVRDSARAELEELPADTRAAIMELSRGRLGNISYAQLRTALESGELTPYARATLAEAIQQIMRGTVPEPTPPRGPPRGPRGGRPAPREAVDSAGLTDMGRLVDLVRRLTIPEPSTLAREGASASEIEAARTNWVARNSARAELRRMRTSDDPNIREAAARVQELMDDPIVTEYARGGRARADVIEHGQRSLMRAIEGYEGPEGHVRGIRQLLDPDVVEAEAAAAQQQLEVAIGQDFAYAMETRPPLRLVGPESGVRGLVPEIRASAERGGGTGEPGVPAAPAGGGRGGSRGPAAPRPPAEAVAERPPPQEVIQVRRGTVERIGRAAGRGIGRLIRHIRSRNQQLEQQRASDAELSEDAEVAQRQVRSRIVRHLMGRLETMVNAEELGGAIQRTAQRLHQATERVAELQRSGAPEAEVRAAAEEVITLRQQSVELETMLRDAVADAQPVGEVIMRLYREGHLSGQLGESVYWDAMLRLYSRPNVRSTLDLLARSNPERFADLGRALEVVDAYVRSVSATPDAFLDRIARTPSEAQIREGVVVRPAAEAETGTGARSRGIPEDVVRETDLIVDLLARQTVARQAEAGAAIDPLAGIEEVLGMEFTPAERAVLMDSLYGAEARTRAVSPDMMAAEQQTARVAAEEILANMTVEVDARAQPVMEAIRLGMESEVSVGGNVEQALLRVLRSSSVETAIREAYGEVDARTFREAIVPRSGEAPTTISAFVDALRMGRGRGGAEGVEQIYARVQLPNELRTPLIEYSDAVIANQELARNFRAVEILERGASEAELAGRQRFRTFGAEGRSIRGQVRRAFVRAGEWALEHEPIGHQGGLRWARRVFYETNAEGEVLRTPDGTRIPSPRGTRLRRAAAEWRPAVRQVFAWGVVGALGFGLYSTVGNLLSDADEIREGVQMARDRYGIGISEDNARWIVGEGMNAQAELRSEVEETFDDLRSDILNEDASYWPFVEEVQDRLRGNMTRNLDRLIVEARQAALAEVGSGREFTNEQRQRIERIFQQLEERVNEEIGPELTGAMGEAVTGLIRDARDGTIEAFEEIAEDAGSERRDGADFYNYIGNDFPQGSERRPRTYADWERAVARGNIYDIRRIDEIFSDGRRMSRQLDRINELIGDRRTAVAEGNAEDQREAEESLLEILRPWHIELEAVVQLLERERKESLEITDMVDLRRADWITRGLVVPFADIAAETFLADVGMISAGEFETGAHSDESRGYVEILTGGREGRELCMTLWDAVYHGNLPSVYVDNALDNLSEGNRLATIRGRIPEVENLFERARTGSASEQREARQQIDAILRPTGAQFSDFQNLRGENLRHAIFAVLLNNHLLEAGYYIVVREPGREEGTTRVRSIRYESFLGMLDHNAILNQRIRGPLEEMLGRYRTNDVALRAFNDFELERITEDQDTGRVRSGETVYGDPRRLAAFIVEVAEQDAIRRDESRAQADRDAATARLRELGALRMERIAPNRTAEVFDPVGAAMRRGFVSSAVLAEIDPRLLDPEHQQLVEFANRRTTVERRQVRREGETRYETRVQAGVVRWLINHRDAVRGHVVDILTDIARPESGCPATAEGVEEWLNNRADYFKHTRGWWRYDVPTPTEIEQSARERARGAVTAGRRGTGPARAVPTREQMMDEELRPTPVRRRGVERIREVEEQPAEAEAAPAEAEVEAPAEQQEPVTGLTADAQAFFQDRERSAGLAQEIDAMIDAMLEVERDRGVLQQVYGENLSDEQAMARIRSDFQAELWRLFTGGELPGINAASLQRQDRRTMSESTITVSGEAGNLSIAVGDTIDMRIAIRQHLYTFTQRRTPEGIPERRRSEEARSRAASETGSRKGGGKARRRRGR